MEVLFYMAATTHCGYICGIHWHKKDVCMTILKLHKNHMIKFSYYTVAEKIELDSNA